MLWYLLSLILSFVVGGLIGAFVVFRKITRDLQGVEKLLEYYGQITEQLGRNQKYLNSVPYKDQRTIHLMKGNASLLSQIKNDAEDYQLAEK